MEEKRALHRIPNHFGFDLKSRIQIGSHTYSCHVKDYNAKAVAIEIDNRAKLELQSANKVALIEIFFGTETVCAVRNPTIAKFDEKTMTLVIELQTTDTMTTPNRQFRTQIPKALVGTCSGEDPVKIGQNLSFKIVDFSSQGFLAMSSKSNRHLMPGLKLKNFDFVLPGAGMLRSDFTIRHVDVDGDQIYFGCQFSNLSKRKSRVINGYYFICLNSTQPDVAMGFLKETKLSLKDFVRIERVSSPQAFEEVLKIRFESYKAANKLKTDVNDYHQMRDQYDSRSIILGAFLGSYIVGTLRIVFSENGSAFPFEESFPMPQNIQREDLVEVSKLAVAPQYQGTDILIKLFQGFAFEYISKRRYAVCMSTQKLSRYYTSIGAKKISDPISHPTLENETLTCYLFDRKRLETGKMRGTAWYLFARDTISMLSKFGFAKKVRFSLRLWLKRAVEQTYLRLKK